MAKGGTYANFALVQGRREELAHDLERGLKRGAAE